VLAAVLTAYVGIFFVVGGFDLRLLAENALGAGLVMFCAATITFYFLVNERIGREIGSVAFTTHAMTAAAAGLAAHFTLTPGWSGLSMTPAAWALLVAMVLVATVLPLFMVAEGVRTIGASRAALVTTVGPPSTILLAWLVLDERLTPGQLAGAALIIAGIVVLELPGRRRRAAVAPAPESGT
jgi:drug/metabolite transporter (DMT)-like permease